LLAKLVITVNDNDYITNFSNFAKIEKMKSNIYILTGLFLFLSSTLFGQYKPVVIGLSFNPGISWINPDNNHHKSEGASFSYSYGLDVDFYFKPNYAFSTGLQIQSFNGIINHPDLYSPSGNENDWESVSSTSSYSYMVFHVPTYIKLKTKPIGYNAYFAEFGLSFYFPFKATQAIESIRNSGEKIDRGSESIMGETNFISVNLLLGAGIEIPVSGDTKLQLFVRYLNGISSIAKGTAFKTDGDGNVASEEITNGGKPSGNKLSYYSKNLSLNIKFIF
jgi:hypothetical protein